jgi:hypothetical protein
MIKLAKTKRSSIEQSAEVIHAHRLLGNLFGLKTSQESQIFDFGSYYRGIDMNTAIDTTPPWASRLLLATSYESKGSKRQLKQHKSQPMNETAVLSQEIAPDGDNLCHDLLGDIIDFGGAFEPATRTLFDAAFAKA